MKVIELVIISIFLIIISRSFKRKKISLRNKEPFALSRNTIFYALCLNDKDFLNNNQKLCGEVSGDDYYVSTGLNLADQIRLSKSGDYINLSDIKVIDQRGNEVTGLRVEMSSVYADAYDGTKLIDGQELTFAHTKNGTEWIKVFLPKETFLGKIILKNRKDCSRGSRPDGTVVPCIEQERAIGLKVETLLKNVVKTTQIIPDQKSEYEFNFNTYGILIIPPPPRPGVRTNATCKGDPLTDNDPSFYQFETVMKKGSDFIKEAFSFMKQFISFQKVGPRFRKKEPFQMAGLVTDKKNLDPYKFYKRGVRKVSNTVTPAVYGGVGCQEFPDEVFLEVGGSSDPSVPATSCTGYDCTIEGQKCLPGTVGSSGKTWICQNKKWVEFQSDPCASFSDSTTNISQECYNKIWKEAGCLTTPPVMGDWQKGQTKAGLIFDSYAWSVMNDDGHRNGCYTTDRSKWPESKTLYGQWIGSDVPAQASKPLLNGERVYMIHSSDNYTKMVSESGVGKYYTGDIDKFRAADWDSYSSAGDGYKIKNS